VGNSTRIQLGGKPAEYIDVAARGRQDQSSTPAICKENVSYYKTRNHTSDLIWI
jgi:hypothetical protein